MRCLCTRQGHDADPDADVPHLDGFVSGSREEEGSGLGALLQEGKSLSGGRGGAGGQAPFGGKRTSQPVASRMAGRAPSGAQETHSTTCWCSRSSALHSLERTAHTRTVWSLEQLAISEPSGLGRTMRTHSRWPAKVFTQYLRPHKSHLPGKHFAQSDARRHFGFALLRSFANVRLDAG